MILVGYSMGGRLALQLASRNESRVAAVVVLGSNPGIEDVDQLLVEPQLLAGQLLRSVLVVDFNLLDDVRSG